MTTAQDNSLLLRDQLGNLYVLPWETVEQARLSDQARAELEARFTAGSPAAGEDTRGYLPPLFWAGATFGSITTGLGFVVGNYIFNGEALGPAIERAVASMGK